MNYKCGACGASPKDMHKIFACTTCKDPHFFLCLSCEPMSMTYHHWRHSFLLIENFDSHKEKNTPNFIVNTIANFTLNDEGYNTILAQKHKEKCDCCLGAIHGIKYQSVPVSTSEKKVIMCDSCFNSSQRLDDPHWSRIYLWMKIRSLFMLAQQPLKSFDAVDLKADIVNNLPAPSDGTAHKKLDSYAKEENGYEYNAEDKAGRYTLYESNSDTSSQHGLRTGVYSKDTDSSSQTAKGRYEDNEDLYKDSYEDNEKQPSNKSKGYYDDSQDDSYSYNADKSEEKKGSYEDNEESKHSGYYDSKGDSYSYNTDENKAQSKKGPHEDNTERNPTTSTGYYEDNANEQKSPQQDKHSGYYDNKDGYYGYNTDSPKSLPSQGGYEDNAEQKASPSKGYYEEDSYSYNEEKGKPERESKTTKDGYDDGYGYNSSQADEQGKQADGYGNDDSYGYNAPEESTHVADSKVVTGNSKPTKNNLYADDEDYESTDSEHSNPFEVHIDGYMQGGDHDEEDSVDGYGAHYQERTGFYKDQQKTPLDASGPIPFHEPRPAAAVVAANVNGARDWNEEFQNIQTMDDSTPEAALEKLHRMHLLSKEFTENAVKLGKTIIEEVDKPAHLKTIKPKNMGGVAGGEKYSEQGIFFKFAIDLFKIYGGDEFAIKAAGLELQGLKCLLQTGIKGLHYPLMILIDYRGYRLIATSMLPLDANSLIYGSGDGAKSIKKEDKTFSKLMKQVGAKLNLKKHQVGFGAITKRLYAPADIEGHRGKDGRYYLLDTARLFPAEPPARNLTGLLIHAYDRTRDERWHPLPEISFVPSLVSDKLMRQLDEYLNSDYEVPVKIESEEFLDGTVYYTNRGVINIRASTLLGKVIQGDVVLVMKGRKGSFLYNLLRPELVASANTPLSSDAFSPFGRHEAPVHNKEVENAWFSSIESMPKKLENMATELEDFLPDKFTRSLHGYGINLRHVGLLRSLSKSKYLADQALVEMITRIAKNYVRNRVRTSKAEDIKEIIVNHFNLLLGTGEASNFFWRFAIKTQIEAKFSKSSLALSLDERKFDFNLRDTMNKLALFQVLQDKIGVRFKESVLEKLTLHPNLLETAYPFKLDDIDSIQVKVKHLLEPDLTDKIMAWIKEHSSDNNVFNPIKASPFLDKFNIPNTEVCHLVLNQALRMLHDKNIFESVALVQKAQEIVEGINLLPIEVTLKIQYIRGCAAYVQKDYDLAHKHLVCAYKILTSVTSTIFNETMGRSDRPFLLLILNMLLRVVYDSGNRLGTLYYTRQFVCFWAKFPCNLPEEEMISLFGSQFPLAVQLFEQVSNLGCVSIPDKEVLQRPNPRANVQQHLLRPLLMEQRSGLLSLASLMERLDDNTDAALSIRPNHRFYKELHFSPRFIKANKAQTVMAYLYGAKAMKLAIKTAGGKYVFEGEFDLVDFGTELTLDLEPGEYCVEAIPTVADKRMMYGLVSSEAYLSVIPPQNGSFNYLLGYNRAEHVPITFIVPDDNPIERVAVFSQRKEDSDAASVSDEYPSRFYALNRLGELWEMTYDKPIATKVSPLLPWKIVQIEQCGTHCVLLAATGEVFTWGSGKYGQLGHGDTSDRPDPRLVEKLKGTKIKRVFAYHQRSFALAENGTLYAWGRYANKGHKSAYLPMIYDAVKSPVVHVAAARDDCSGADPTINAVVFTTETGHLYISISDNSTVPSIIFCDFLKDRFFVECAVFNNKILALDASGNITSIVKRSLVNVKEFCEEKQDVRTMYLHGRQHTNIDNSSTEAVVTLTTDGEIYFEDRAREYNLKHVPRLFSEIRGHTVSQFSCTRDYLIALPGPPPALPAISQAMMQQRILMEAVSGALNNTKLDVKFEDLIIKVHWSSPITRHDNLAVNLVPVDPPQDKLKYGAAITLSEDQQEGDVWFSPTFDPQDNVLVGKLRKFPVPTGPSGSYYVNMYVNDKEVARSPPLVVDFTDPQMVLEPVRDEVNPGQPITWKYSSRSRRTTEVIQVFDVESDMLVSVILPAADPEAIKKGELTLTGTMEGCRYYARWSFMYTHENKPAYQFMMRSREVAVKLSQKYITEQDVLELKVSSSHVKPSSTIKVSWKFNTSRLSYKETIAIINDSCKGYVDWTKLSLPKQLTLPEGSVEMDVPHTEGEYSVAIMLNGVGYIGRKVKSIPLVVDANAPDPVTEQPVEAPAAIVLAVNNNNNGGGGHSEQLLQLASLKTEFASWKDFLVAAGVNNAEMYGSVATATNLPVSLIPVVDSFLIAKLGIVDAQDVAKILLKALEIREARIAKFITGTK